jgi:hypothetical protein
MIRYKQEEVKNLSAEGGMIIGRINFGRQEDSGCR